MRDPAAFLRPGSPGWRHALHPRFLPVAYILALCLVYVMHNIWAARTAYDFVVLPAALLIVRPRDWLPVVKDPVFLAVGAYFTALALACLAAPDRQAAVFARHVEQSLLVLSFIAITAILVRRHGQRFIIGGFLVLSVAAAAAALLNIVAYYHHLSIEKLWTDRLQGIPGITMYYNSNVVGDVYAIAFSCAAALIAQRWIGREQLKRWQLTLAVLAAAILLLTIVLSGSRGALLGTVAPVCGLLMLRGSWRQRIAWLGTIAAGLGLLFLLRPPVPMDMLSRADSFRLSLWPVYLKLAAARPWLGYGLSFDTTIKLANGVTILNPHNIILAAQIRGGLVSSLALVTVLLLSLRRAWGGWTTARTPFAVVLMTTCVLVTGVDYEFLASPLGFPWLLLWLPVGASLGVAGLARDSGPISRREFPVRPEASELPSSAVASR